MNLTMDFNATMRSDPQQDALNAKIITMVCLFSVSMVSGCLPLLISLKWDWFTNTGPDMRSSNKLVLGLLAFGGGVLFATTFMHLLPEIDENIHLLEGILTTPLPTESGEIRELPFFLAGLIMCCGFFMMYLIDELVHIYIRSREKSSDKGITRALSVRVDGENNDRRDRRSSSLPTIEKEIEASDHSHFPVSGDDDSIAGALRGLLIVLALSVHELFEGLAVGLESSAADVWYMFGAVSAHKYIIAFCIGVELLAAQTKTWLSVLYIFTFSFVSALGIGVGILLVGGAGAADAGLASVVLQGIACGTLVYVVFFEIWRQDRKGLLQFTGAIVGFTLMFITEVLVEILGRE